MKITKGKITYCFIERSKGLIHYHLTAEWQGHFEDTPENLKQFQDWIENFDDVDSLVTKPIDKHENPPT